MCMTLLLSERKTNQNIFIILTDLGNSRRWSFINILQSHVRMYVLYVRDMQVLKMYIPAN